MTQTQTATRDNKAIAAKAAATRAANKAARNGNPPPARPSAPLPHDVERVRSGVDYQVAHPRLINGRHYEAGEILDQHGLTQRQIEMWRDQRILIDVPIGGEPVMPVPSKKPPQPLTRDEKAALSSNPDKAQGKVTPKHKGFGKWACVDSDGKTVGPLFEGDKGGYGVRTRCLQRCIEINEENGHEVTDEERAEALLTLEPGEGS